MRHSSILSPADSGILVVDVQEKLMPLIPRGKQIVANMRFLLEVAKVLNVYAQATEQYPKGLGGTVPELAAYFPQRPEKSGFSCCAIPEVTQRFRERGCKKVLVVGIEAHVCVLQTVLDLLAEGFVVHVAADSIAGRYELDHDIALRRMERAGAILTTAETAAFELTGQSGTPEFKAISKLVQERMKMMT
jgi:nicotinamidase-related amidase